jgi:NAD(P)-dependent dehydrogenase (short-subunit alcohol dehydrogenase family)
MGEALSRDLVANGWQVAMADIAAKESLQQELGDKASFYKCNVADYDSQAKMFQEVWDKYGRLDALCANAGIVDKRSERCLRGWGVFADGVVAPFSSSGIRAQTSKRL